MADEAELADLLGIDMSDPLNQHAKRLAGMHSQLIWDLVQIRERKGLTRREVAERCGWKRSRVADFERIGGDPWLSSISRYALAVGADITLGTCQPIVLASPPVPEAQTRSSSPLKRVVAGSSPVRLRLVAQLAEHLTIASSTCSRAPPTSCTSRSARPGLLPPSTEIRSSADFVLGRPKAHGMARSVGRRLLRRFDSCQPLDSGRRG